MIVAVSESKWGGKCHHCESEILRGGVIFKIAAEGETTKHGQGPGYWVGSCCKPLFVGGMLTDEAEDERTLFDA